MPVLGSSACCISRKAGCNQQRLWLLTLEALAEEPRQALQLLVAGQNQGAATAFIFEVRMAVWGENLLISKACLAQVRKSGLLADVVLGFRMLGADKDSKERIKQAGCPQLPPHIAPFPSLMLSGFPLFMHIRIHCHGLNTQYGEADVDTAVVNPCSNK